VYDAALVRMRQRPCHLAQQPRTFLRREHSLVADPLAQRLPLDVRHHEEHRVGRFIHGEDGNDVGVREPRHRARFIQKAPARAGVGSLQRGQQFDGDLALEDQLAREEHHAHATPAEAPLQHVATGQRAVERAVLGIEVS